MRLISLSASESSFKTIHFNRQGASFIVAKQKNPESSDKSKTYNGVGKSLLVSLIDFCLGARANKITKSLQKNLKNWHFILKIEIENRSYKITRYTNSPKFIILDNEKLNISSFCKRLEGLCFSIPSNFQYLSFRALLPFFIRPSKQSYQNYDLPIKEFKPYQKQLSNAFLLGLDIDLSDKKMQLKKELDAVILQSKNIEQDPILKEFFESNQDSILVIKDLDEDIKKLEYKLQNFEVAENYYQKQTEADEIQKSIEQTKNQILLKKNNIDNINKSLEITPDVERNQIEKIYTESKLVFQKDIEKKFLDLEKFYKNLIVNRKRRLTEQKNIFTTELNELEKKSKNFQENFDECLKFLNAHQALEVFTKVSNQLTDLKQKKDKLQNYEKLKQEYAQKRSLLQKEMINQNEKTIIYINDAKSSIDNILNYFRKLVRTFYPSMPAGITVRNNEGNNQTRYDIEAKIESDASDGINSVKLFCYDLTLLMAGNNHSMNFIFHDSRLFSNIDETHCDELFKIVKDKFSNKQYIANINQNQFNSLTEDIKKFITYNRVLELTDDSDSEKLLGIKVDLDYD